MTIGRNRWARILGVCLVMYVLANIDRANLAMAVPAIRSGLGLTPAAIGFAVSGYFWGYIIFQIPAGRLAGIGSPKRILLGLMLAWSLASLTTAFVHTERELLLNRFFLGLAEGGVLTSILVLIRRWFTRGERARANSIFLMSLALGPLIANPISGVILTYADWRWMFVIEALPGFLWAAVWLHAVDDDPAQAAWLPPEEKAQLVEALAAERASVRAPRGHWLATLWQPAVLLLALYNFFALMAEWGVGFWLPTALKETHLSIGIVGLVAALPQALGIAMMLLVGASSDRRRERKWHMIASTAAAGGALLLMQVMAGSSWATVALLLASIVFFLGRFGPFWALPGEILPPAVAGVGIGLINGAGNLGGAIGPYAFGIIKTNTGSFILALLAAGCAFVVSCLFALPIRVANQAERAEKSLYPSLFRR
jgi:MFS family permease